MTNKISMILSTLKMAVATFCSRILGLVREQVLAYMFGASGLTDAFLIAFRIPNLLRDLFAEGAFSSAFVPKFVEENLKSKEHGRELLWALFILLGSLTLLLSVIIFFAADDLVRLMAPTFVETPEKFELTVLLTKIMAPFLCFVSIAALFMGSLNSLGIFFVPAMAPALFNVVVIASMLFLTGYFVSEQLNPILSLGVGVFFGGLLQALMQIPFLIKNKLYPIIPKKIFSQQAKQVFILLGPGLLGFAATQINLIVTTVLASSTIVGAVSWLNYAFRLFQLPVGILSVSIGNSHLVHFSKEIKAGNQEEALQAFKLSYFMSFLLVLPAMGGMYLFSEEIVFILFERGAFSHESTLMTALALKFYAVGLPFYGLYKIFVPSFYAIDKQKIPVYSSIFSIICNLIFCVLLTPHYGFKILALGTSLSISLNIIIQAIVFKRYFQISWNYYFNLRIAKLIFCMAVCFVCFAWCKSFFSFYEIGFGLQLFYLFGALGLFLLIYLLLVLALGEKALVLKLLRKSS